MSLALGVLARGCDQRGERLARGLVVGRRALVHQLGAAHEVLRVDRDLHLLRERLELGLLDADQRAPLALALARRDRVVDAFPEVLRRAHVRDARVVLLVALVVVCRKRGATATSEWCEERTS